MRITCFQACNQVGTGDQARTGEDLPWKLAGADLYQVATRSQACVSFERAGRLIRHELK